MILVAGSEAVDVANFGSVGCTGNPMGGCVNVPQMTCCRFRDTHTDNVLARRYQTHSVAWWNLQACDVASWFRKNLRTQANCGRVKANVIGPATFTCQTTTNIPEYNDGAMWSVNMFSERNRPG